MRFDEYSPDSALFTSITHARNTSAREHEHTHRHTDTRARHNTSAPARYSRILSIT